MAAVWAGAGEWITLSAKTKPGPSEERPGRQNRSAAGESIGGLGNDIDQKTR
jgi:hypothetical protein